MTVNRYCGLFFVMFGAALYGFLIPFDTETVGSGWVLPDTLPNFAALTMIAAGLLQAATPAGATAVDAGGMLRAGMYLALAAGALVAMDKIGFLVAAPVYALTQMWAIGERRPLWLGVGVLAVPGIVWILAAGVLDRPLP